MNRFPLKEIARLIPAAVRNWQNDKAPRLGAALAYYMALSLAPTIVIMLAMAGWAFGAKAATGRLVWQIQSLMGPQGALLVQTLIDGAHQPSHGIAATLLGLVTLFFGATAVVSELKDALNTIWRVPEESFATTGQTIFKLIEDRFLSFLLVLGAGFYLLVSVAFSAWISLAGRYIGPLTAPPVLIRAVDWGVSFAVTTALLAFIYKVLPQVRLKWLDVISGAALTSLLFTTGKYLLGVYLAKAGFADTYGAAGSLVILLVWIYYTAQLLYLGAEFTRVYALRFGSLFPGDLHFTDPKVGRRVQG